MKLKSFNYLIGLLIILLNSPVLGEEKIDIWKNKKDKSISESETIKKEKSSDKTLFLNQLDLYSPVCLHRFRLVKRIGKNSE